MTKTTFQGVGHCAGDLLELIHNNVCGLLNHVTHDGSTYFMTFTDDKSRYEYIYLMRHKSEIFDKFKIFRNEVEK